MAKEYRFYEPESKFVEIGNLNKYVLNSKDNKCKFDRCVLCYEDCQTRYLEETAKFENNILFANLNKEEGYN